MKNISTAAASREVRKVRDKVERALILEKKKQGLPKNVSLWCIERTDWGAGCRNTEWRVCLGHAGECYSGHAKTSVLQALKKATQNYHRKRGQHNE